MKCPVCKIDLVVTGQEALETLSEHVTCSEPSLKSVYQCPNIKCKAHEYGAVWNYDGEYYSYKMEFKQSKDLEENHFIGKNNGPFGSFSRQANVEIYCNGLKKRIWLSPNWTFGWLKPVIRYTYQSNKDGDVLKRGWKVEFYKRDTHFDGKKGRHCILWHSFYHMFKFSMEDFYKRKKRFENSTKENAKRYSAQDFIDQFEDNDKRRYRKTKKWFINFFYARSYKKAKSYL